MFAARSHEIVSAVSKACRRPEQEVAQCARYLRESGLMVKENKSRESWTGSPWHASNLLAAIISGSSALGAAKAVRAMEQPRLCRAGSGPEHDDAHPVDEALSAMEGWPTALVALIAAEPHFLGFLRALLGYCAVAYYEGGPLAHAEIVYFPTTNEGGAVLVWQGKVIRLEYEPEVVPDAVIHTSNTIGLEPFVEIAEIFSKSRKYGLDKFEERIKEIEKTRRGGSA